MKYADASHTIIDAGDGRFIPADPSNADYQALGDQQIDDYNPPPPAPVIISKVTILDRLNAAGLVSAAFQAMGGPGSYVYERWQAAGDQIDVDHPLVVHVLDAIGADKAVILAAETSKAEGAELSIKPTGRAK